MSKSAYFWYEGCALRQYNYEKYFNRISYVMVSVLVSSVVDCGFEPRLGQTKDYGIGICWFSA